MTRPSCRLCLYTTVSSDVVVSPGVRAPGMTANLRTYGPSKWARETAQGSHVEEITVVACGPE